MLPLYGGESPKSHWQKSLPRVPLEKRDFLKRASSSCLDPLLDISHVRNSSTTASIMYILTRLKVG